MFRLGHVVKPRQVCWAGFISMLMCVCVSVCVCLLTRYPKNYLTNQLHIWGEPSLWLRDEVIRFWEKSLRGKSGCVCERSNSRSIRFQSVISRKGSKLGPMLLLTINRKPYIASPMTPSLLTLSDLERSKSRSLRFQSLISRKGAELGPMLLLTTNRKPHMVSSMSSSLLTLSDLERSMSRSLTF